MKSLIREFLISFIIFIIYTAPMDDSSLFSCYTSLNTSLLPRFFLFEFFLKLRIHQHRSYTMLDFYKKK